MKHYFKKGLYFCIDLIKRILSSCSGFKFVLRSCITTPASENSHSIPVEVAGIEKIERARQDNCGNFSWLIFQNSSGFEDNLDLSSSIII